jgi:hypothetical protein
MIQFNILKFTDKTGNLSDPQTLANFKFYLKALADQVNQSIVSKNVIINVNLTITPESFISATGTAGYIYDPAQKKFANVVEHLMQTGIDLSNGNGGFTLTYSAGATEAMNAQLATKYEATALGALALFDHEFGHGLAFNTFRDAYTGSLGNSGDQTTFDKFVSIVLGQPFFTGKNASAIYGSSVPLYKLGDPGTSIAHFTKAFINGTITDQLGNDLMNGYGGFTPREGRLYTDLDIAVFLDCGYKNIDTLVSYDGLKFIPGVNTTSVTATAAKNDTVLLQGQRKDFVVSRVGNDLVETSKLDNQTIKLSGVERIAFDDALVAYDIDGNAGQAYRLYQAAFNRTPDKAGLGYWIGQMDSGAENLNHVAAGFVGSAEFQKLYGVTISNNGYLTALYSNVLHRTPDQAGFDYWNERIQSGMTRGDILASFSESTENQAQVIGQIQNGFEYLTYHA